MSELNMNPEFTTEETAVEPTVGATEVAEQETVEKDTQSDTPSDIEAEKEVSTEKPVENDDNTDSLVKQVQGLKSEKEKLLDEIKTLRGTKREIKQEELNRVNDKLEDLKDVNPDDVSLIEKVLRAKGYVSKAEVEKMSYEAIKNDELNKFLDEFPEYKPTNDPNDINWNALQREFGLYRAPSDARQIGELLRRAHKNIAKTTSDQGTEIKRQAVKTASVGGGSSQRSPVRKSSNPRLAELIKSGALQGFTDEELAKIEQNI